MCRVILMMLLVAVGTTVSWSGEVEDGVAAHERKDYKTALNMFRSAAQKGNADAQNNLGVMYSHGNGVPQDYAASAKWHRLAAQQGNANAQYNLGMMYNMGQGVPQNEAEALKWFRLAAQQGVASAQFSLGLMYARGRGVPLDRVSAYMWFILAVDSGSVDAIKARDTAAPFLSLIQRGVARVGADNCKANNFKVKGCD